MLFVYLSSHLINHAVGLISLRAAETVLAIAKSICTTRLYESGGHKSLILRML